MAQPLEFAKTLNDIYKAFSLEPLKGGQQIHKFYAEELNDLRGGDKVERIWMNLRRHYDASFYRAFLMGHQGVGKSTELWRLLEKAQRQYRPVRFSATRDLNPAGFTPFDVLLVMLVRLMEEVDKCGGRKPSETLLRDVENWFTTRTRVTSQRTDSSAETKGEAGAKTPSLIAQIVSLGVSFSASRKYAYSREDKTEETATASIPELISLVNRLLSECNGILKESEEKEWLFIGEDFDKSGIPPAQTEELFLKFGNIFHELQTHMIFTIPLSLVYSDRASQLPFGGDRIQGIPDTPVFQADHTPDDAGRQAIGAVLDKRIAPDLFAGGQRTRLIVASGGNLRDLFKLIADAADTALLRHAPDGKIGSDDVTSAINELRKEYRNRLSESISDEQQTVPVTWDRKALRLLEVYANGEKDPISDPVMFSLFRARAVQEFNGRGWYGVHPLVVDILGRQGRIKADAHGRFPGGTI